ncbi:MAG: DUF481 domain-containing protein [Candidatus Alcyoniella australis]|nr:DUF481 domain-containing protein [Candidatus Alcyoniella australis]
MKHFKLISAMTILVLLIAVPAIAQDEATEGDQFPKWSASGTLGYTMTSAYVKTNSLVGELQGAREGVWTNHLLKGGVTYGNVIYPDGDPILNANSYFGEYKFEGYLLRNKKPYLWGLLGYQSDEFSGFWTRYLGEVGVGYSFLGISDSVLKTELGYAFVDTRWIEKKEIETDEFHFWEPTHNALARLIAEVPLKSYMLFSEEASVRLNLADEDDYTAQSTTGLSFKLSQALSFKTSFAITYTNTPGFIERLDKEGNVVNYDDDGDVDTDDVPELINAEYASYTWINALVISFF